MNHVLIVGGAGFIGQTLVKAFVMRGYRVTVFDMNVGRYEHELIRYHSVDVQGGKLPSLPPCNVVINLAGATINHKFTSEYKKTIWSSRVITTRSLRQWVETQSWQPSVYIGASATGYYGDRNNEIQTEHSKPGTDTLARVCLDWEREHAAFAKIGVPAVIIRQGSVIGNGGMLSELIPWYRHGIKLSFGNGENFMPWIDIRDLVGIYCAIASGITVTSILNAVSPQPIRHKEFTRELGSILRAHIPLPIPVWLLRMKLGELGLLMTYSQRVAISSELIPLINHGDIRESLESLLLNN